MVRALVYIVGALLLWSSLPASASPVPVPVDFQLIIDEQNEYISELEQLVAELSREVAELEEENRWDTVVFLKDPEGVIDEEFRLISEYRKHKGERDLYEVNESRLVFENVSNGVQFEIDALIGELVVIHSPLEKGEPLSYDACFNGFECRAMQEQARIVDE